MEAKSRKNEFVNREAWTLALWRNLDPIFDELARRFPAVKAPEKVRIATGFTPGGKQQLLEKPGKKAGFPGHAYHPSASADGHAELFIGPHVDDPLEVGGIITHLRLSVSLPIEVKHGRRFREPAIYLGLEGQMVRAMPDEKLRKRLMEEVVGPLGPYPHAKLDFSSPPLGKTKQTTRMLKCWCVQKDGDGDCPYLIRTAASNIRRAVPICPVHLVPFEHEPLPDAGKPVIDAEPVKAAPLQLEAAE